MLYCCCAGASIFGCCRIKALSLQARRAWFIDCQRIGDQVEPVCTAVAHSKEFVLQVTDLLINAAVAPVVCCQGTVAQPQKQSDKYLKPGVPDISALSLELQQEWHPDNNALLGGKKVKPYSDFKATWSCPKCPAGCSHIWKTRVSQRTLGTKCPYCEGKKVCKHNSLATKAPRQMEYWNQDTNAKTPEQMLAGSKLRANWRCPTCNHEWQAEIAKRVRYDSGCPRCSKRGLGKRTKQPTFKVAKHELLLQWDYVRNSKANIHPHNITLGSSKYVHWVCQQCPKGQLHRYTARARQRTTKRSSGCPYCAGKQACECNSLQAHHPVISSEWDYARNDMTPADVTARSNQVVWWKNNARGSWLQCIAGRTRARGKPNQ